MRILIFGNYAGGKVFYKELLEWLAKTGVEVDMLDWGNYTLHQSKSNSLQDVKPQNRLLFALTKVKFIRKVAKIELIRKTLETIQEPYDVINVHYGNAANNPYLDLFKSKGKKLVVTIWGSDYDRLPDDARQAARKLYNQADAINFGNPDMRDDFTSYFGNYHNKAAIAGFGDSKLESIIDMVKNEPRSVLNKRMGYPESAFVITCGYKAFHVLQHLKIVEAIEKIAHVLPENYILSFPLAYHRDENYVQELKTKLDSSGLRYVAHESLYSEQDLVALRVASDIYITIPQSDGASFSLLEYLTAGNVVLAGEWLPYQFHRNLGLEFHSVSLENLADNLAYVLQNYDEQKELVKANGHIVLNEFGWAEKVKEWHRLYQSVL